MNCSIEQKKSAVAELINKIQDSKAVLAFKYQGLTVEQFQQLRRDMRTNGCDVKIVKNNISRRATIECGYQELADSLTGPVAMVFAKEDMVAPAKEIFKFAKDFKNIEVIKGVVDGDVYDFDKLKALSSLPSYETLLTQLAAGMLGTVRELAIGLNMLVEKEA